MNTEISLDYNDVLKAYQTKCSELLSQMITVEAKLNASTALILRLQNKIGQLEEENQKFQKVSSKTSKKNNSIAVENGDEVIDYS